MKRYEILPHRADLKIRARGRTKEEIFQNALFGMSKNMKPEIKEQKEKIKREIKISSPDRPSLLVDFLSEALYLAQTNKEVYFDLKLKKISNNEIKGELVGQKVKRFGEDIKAATHHDLEVRQKKDKTWEAIVLFDI